MSKDKKMLNYEKRKKFQTKKVATHLAETRHRITINPSQHQHSHCLGNIWTFFNFASTLRFSWDLPQFHDYLLLIDSIVFQTWSMGRVHARQWYHTLYLQQCNRMYLMWNNKNLDIDSCAHLSPADRNQVAVRTTHLIKIRTIQADQCVDENEDQW